MVLWLLNLVHQCHRIVACRNAALALRIGQELVTANTIFPGPVAGAEHRRGTDKRPVQVRLIAKEIKELRGLLRTSLPLGRKIRLINEPFSGLYLEAPSTSDNNEALHAGMLYGGNNRTRSVSGLILARIERADHDVMTRDGGPFAPIIRPIGA